MSTAQDTLRALEKGAWITSGAPDRYQGEDGREYLFAVDRTEGDGAITGSIYGALPGAHRPWVASFRIRADGRITKGPRAFRTLVDVVLKSGTSTRRE